MDTKKSNLSGSGMDRKIEKRPNRRLAMIGGGVAAAVAVIYQRPKKSRWQRSGR